MLFHRGLQDSACLAHCGPIFYKLLNNLQTRVLRLKYLTYPIKMLFHRELQESACLSMYMYKGMINYCFINFSVYKNLTLCDKYYITFTQK